MTDTAPKPSAAHEAFDILRTVIAALMLALVMRVAVFQPFTIPSESMQPGLLVGDYLVISKFDYGWSRWSFPGGVIPFEGRLFARGPKRGDIVVFRHPAGNHDVLIKRVVGLPGDRVQVTGGVVSINGQAVERLPLGTRVDPGRDPLAVEAYHEALGGRTFTTFDRGTGGPGDDTQVYEVPRGHYFMMGDNRDNSLDSRWTPAEGGVGFVPAENLLGRARFIVASWQPRASLWKPWTWVKMRDGRALSALT